MESNETVYQIEAKNFE